MSTLSPSKDVCIPQDIINLIVDEVARTYNASSTLKNHPLHNCALVCSAFYSRTTHHIFSRIEIIQSRTGFSSSALMSRIACLLDILTSNPVIGSAVRTLVIQAGDDKLVEVSLSERNSESKLASSFWSTKNPALVGVLKHLNVLQEIIFRGGIGLLMWKGLHRDTASAFRTIIASSSLRSLELHRLSGIPSRILLDCQRLKKITLRNVDVRLGSLSNVPRIGPMPTFGPEYQHEADYVSLGLEYLDLTCSHTVNPIVVLWAKRRAFSHLKYVEIDIGTDTQDYILILWFDMLQAARSLQMMKLCWSQDIHGIECLRITPEGISTDIYLLPDNARSSKMTLAMLPSLRLLHLQFGRDIRNASNYIQQFLDMRGLNSNLMIKTIYISANWHRINARDRVLGGEWWQQMDNILCNKGYARLQNVVLVQTSTSTEDTKMSWWREHELDETLTRTKVNFGLPRLLERGSVSVETCRLP